jgi:hypothetical protein
MPFLALALAFEDCLLLYFALIFERRLRSVTRPDRLTTTALLSLFAGLACSSSGGHADAGGNSGSAGAGTAGASGAAGAAGRGSTSDASADVGGPTTRDASGDGPAANEGPGVFVAVGTGGRRIRSIDYGVSWVDDVQLEANGGDDMDALRAVVWGNQQFVAIGYHTITSPDGKTWTDHGVNAIQQWIGGIVYAQGLYVGMGGFGLRATSTDAIAWQDHSIDTTASHTGDGVVYDAGHSRFVAVNDNGQRSSSANGSTWAYSTGVTSTTTSELAAGNGVVVSLGGKAVVLSSDGGQTWSTGATLGTTCQGLIFAQGHFSALANGHVFTSTDGQTWTDHSSANATSGQIAYGHGTYVLLNSFNLSRSTDGVTWGQSVTVPGTANYLQWIAFGPTG